MIPVKKDKLWALYDKSGNQLTEYKYDRFGYIASNNREALNLLVIPNYNVLVALKDEKYTLINSSGDEIIATVADDIYMTIAGGEKHYYITVNDQRIDAEEWMNVNAPSIHTDNTNNQAGNNNTNNQEQQNDNRQETNPNNNQENDNDNEGQQETNNNDNGEEQPNGNENEEEQRDNNVDEENQNNEEQQNNENPEENQE